MNKVQAQALEEHLQATARGPRVTEAEIDSKIVDEAYHRFPGTNVTVCLLTLANGYGVVGESSCVSAENFDPVVGASYAFANAREKIWALEGYALRERLAAPAAAVDCPHAAPHRYCERCKVSPCPIGLDKRGAKT